MEKDFCGKKSMILESKEKPGEFLGMVLNCKNISCPICGQRIQEYVKDQVEFYAQTLGLKFFATLTTGETDVNIINAKFERLMKDVRLLELEYFVKNNPQTREKAIESYWKYVNNLYDSEHFLIWYFGKKLTDDDHKKGIYASVTTIGFDLTKMLNKIPAKIKRDHVKPMLEKLNGKKPRTDTIETYYKQNIESHRKKWIGKKYVQIGKANQKREFQSDFAQWFKDISKVMYDEKFTEEEKQEYRKYIPQIGSKLSFIKAMEFHPKAYAKGLKIPHNHSLTNRYIPMQLIEKYFAGNIYDFQDAEQNARNSESINLEDKPNADYDDFTKYVANYLAKYITKTTLEVYDEIRSQSDVNFKVLTHSDDISIVFEEAFKSQNEGKFKVVKMVNGALPSSSKKYKTIDEFDNDIIENLTAEHPNKKIQEVMNTLIEYQKAARKKGLTKEERENLENVMKATVLELHRKALELELARRKDVNVKPLKLKGKIKKEGLSNEQLQAIKGLTQDKMFQFLIGYAGTGKTHTLSRLLGSIDTTDTKVGVITYAAKAVQRIKQMAKKQGLSVDEIDISTIHMLCGAKMSQIYYPTFYNDWNKQLDYDVIFIDEYSLVPMSVFISFLSAIKPTTKVIFIGDEAQINPVGSRNPLYYLKEAKVDIEQHELTKVFRSGEKIAKIANEVRNGEIKNVVFEKYDFRRIEELKKKGFQILTNSKSLKNFINAHFQKGKNDVVLKYNYNKNDVVMIVKNDRYRKYFNGEFAEILEIDSLNKIVYLKTIGTEIEFTMTFVELNNKVEPSHALTIHKSQGSEFEKVLVIIDSSKTFLTNRNILYTAITRAEKNFVVMLGENQELTNDVKNRLIALQN